MKTQQEIIEKINNLKKEIKQLKKELAKPSYYLYAHIFPNNKYYIGIAKDTDKRWEKGSGYKSNPPLYEAIEKYGWDNIKHIIIQEYKEKRYAESAEIFLIYAFNSTNNCFGYNRYSFLGNIGTNDIKRKEELNRLETHCKVNKEKLEELEKSYKKLIKGGAKI